jgi:hypothetical protein
MRPLPLVAALASGAIVLATPPARAQVNTEVLCKRIKVTGYTFIIEGAFD